MSDSSSDQNQRRVPEEKGPFGKARKRGTSRAKTPTTKSAADEAKLENIRAIDDIFGRFKADEDKKRSVSARPVAALPPSASAPNLIDAGGLTVSFQASGATPNGAIKEPKEVILYGYGADAQWAAISHYERVSGGLIYEEYDREPYNPKFGYSFASQRSLHYKSLNKSALRKVNEYVGGDHWIKVTFDSAEAAERACHYSPKSIQGWTVYAEPYRGTGPTGGDRAIRAEAGGLSQTASPNTVSSATVGARGASQSSTTVSSATATASIPASQGLLSRSITEPSFARASGAFPSHVDDLYAAPAPQTQTQTQLQSQDSANTTSTTLNPRSQRATLRLKGANVKPAVFLPQEKAFLPSPPRWQQTFGSLPIIGWVIGSGQGIIGDQVPRKEDGTFDEKSASLYWRVWYMVDSCLGSDFCAVKDAEYDD
ncbi:Nn.00g094880.m01.CDS01 [Neocucurbitaria sp. VM-36]